MAAKTKVTVADAPKDATSRERAWFPKVESVALVLLGYIIEGDGRYTLEDIVDQMGCNSMSAGSALWQLRRVGYVEYKRASDRIPAKRNPKWGRNLLRATQRGRMRLAKHEEDLKKEEGRKEFTTKK